VTATGTGLGTTIRVGARLVSFRNDRFDLREERSRVEPAKGVTLGIAGEWASHLGPTGGFADGATPVKLLNDISRAKLVWESAESDIGFGVADAAAMDKGYARGTGLAQAGAASPILAGGLVIQSYSIPSGSATDETVLNRLDGEFAGFARICAGDCVSAIEANSGKVKWGCRFGDGINYASGPRGIWNVTPCSAGGRVFAFGSSGRVYALGLAKGEFLWESHIGAAHERLERARKEACVEKRLARTPDRPYGMLVVAGDALLAPDWEGGLVAFDPPTGKTLLKASTPAGLTSGYNAPVPLTVNHKTYVACVNGAGELRLIDPATGRVLWSHALGVRHAPQPVFGKELLLVFERHPEARHPADTADAGRLGALAGYRLREDGPQRLWQLDGGRYRADLSVDAAMFRKLATRGDGVVYCAVQSDGKNRLAIAQESDGKVLGLVEDCGDAARFHLWGDRLFLASDSGLDGHGVWRTYDLTPDRPVLLSTSAFPSRNKRVNGSEIPTYEVFVDGWMFSREWRAGWGGGVFCYDLRAGQPGEAQ
jgi:outer membrane protein assembly factor BamB